MLSIFVIKIRAGFWESYVNIVHSTVAEVARFLHLKLASLFFFSSAENVIFGFFHKFRTAPSTPMVSL